MMIKTFPVGAFQCNCTILGDEKTGEAIVIDPGDEAERIIKEIKALGLTVKHIIHTHAHLDHIGGTNRVKSTLGGKIGLHKDDLFLYENIAMQGSFLGMQMDPNVKPVDHYLVHGDVLEWGENKNMEVLHTPGHTPGSLCFFLKNGLSGQNILFSGDTLFMGSIGRTDLWGGDYDLILSSIKEKLLGLNNTIVITGHGPQTTIERERKLNPFLQDL